MYTCRGKNEGDRCAENMSLIRSTTGSLDSTYKHRGSMYVPSFVSMTAAHHVQHSNMDWEYIYGTFQSQG